MIPIIAPVGSSLSSNLLSTGVKVIVGVATDGVIDVVGGGVVNILEGATSVITIINKVAM